MDLKELEAKIKGGYAIGREEAVALSRLENKEPLYALADRIRIHFNGDRLETCSIMNARSGHCGENCKWCAQSRFHSTKIDTYPMVDIASAVEMARNNARKGVDKFSLVTSGKRLSGSDFDQACRIYDAIREVSGIALCASMGLIGREQMERLKACGVTSYHCNLETAPSYFGELCTTHTQEEKIETLNHARELGMNVCSGGIIGMGETMEQRIELALKLREIGADSIPMNILDPIPGTPLEHIKPLAAEEVLTTFALFRLINPAAKIRFAGGRSRIASVQEQALRGGINAALVGDLLTTVGSDIETDRAMFERLGFRLNEREG